MLATKTMSVRQCLPDWKSFNKKEEWEIDVKIFWQQCKTEFISFSTDNPSSNFILRKGLNSRRVCRRVTSKPCCWRRPDCASSPFVWLTSSQCKWSPTAQLPDTASTHSWVISNSPISCIPTLAESSPLTWFNPSIPHWLGQSCQPLPKASTSRILRLWPLMMWWWWLSS